MSTEDRLQSLYPFLHGRRQDAATLKAALIESVRQKALEHRTALDEFFANNREAVIAAAETIAGVYRAGGRMFAMGNGGSSCDAAHFSVEFLHPITAGRVALPAIQLTDDIAMKSAVGNAAGSIHYLHCQFLGL